MACLLGEELISNVCAARYPEGVKTSGWVASAVGAVVLVGGGIWGVQALTDKPDTESAPVVTETPAPSVEPTEAVETPDAEPEPEETVAPEYSEAEQDFLDWARPGLEFDGFTGTDDEILTGLATVCEWIELDQLGQDNPDPLPGQPETANATLVNDARFGTFKGGDYCAAI